MYSRYLEWLTSSSSPLSSAAQGCSSEVLCCSEVKSAADLLSSTVSIRSTYIVTCTVLPYKEKEYEKYSVRIWNLTCFPDILQTSLQLRWATVKLNAPVEVLQVVVAFQTSTLDQLLLEVKHLRKEIRPQKTLTGFYSERWHVNQKVRSQI